MTNYLVTPNQKLGFCPEVRDRFLFHKKTPVTYPCTRCNTDFGKSEEVIRIVFFIVKIFADIGMWILIHLFGSFRSLQNPKVPDGFCTSDNDCLEGETVIAGHGKLTNPTLNIVSHKTSWHV